MLTRHNSTSSSHCSSTKSSRSIWSKISDLFHHSKRRNSRRQSATTDSSHSTLSEESVKTVETVDIDRNSSQRRHRKQLVNHADYGSPQMMIPPFSPTYCKTNEFPYSNFYSKLPDGRWMIRYRDGNRDILRTDIMEGYMI
ncbi:hypothetical protein INT48_002690 [Thamnidium elegans]|uniref:Uncharacterized protein n=1 Tax=Thamnidium elegans TaxID=101142 RepID=A0A8H7SZ50_9FUNG|nr:hypothetical protein INT48_002690 [Thamnidium elegans]